VIASTGIVLYPGKVVSGSFEAVLPIKFDGSDLSSDRPKNNAKPIAKKNKIGRDEIRITFLFTV
jgi:hypothetical protein